MLLVALMLVLHIFGAGGVAPEPAPAPGGTDFAARSEAAHESLTPEGPIRSNADYAVDQPPLGPDGRPASVPEPPVNLTSGAVVREKVGATISFSDNVHCGLPWGEIGTVTFEYYLWKGHYPGDYDPNNIGGAVLWGGFDETTGCDELPGWQWGWVQIISASDPGPNEWNAAPDQWFVDSANRTDPRYPNAVAGYTAGFQDWPYRPLAHPADTWFAELGLVCLDLAHKRMRVAATLLWGYTISATGEVAEDDVYGNPGGWGPMTQNFYDTVKHDWPDADGPDFKDWTVEGGCCCQATTPVEAISWGVIKALYR
jgi:hypothetical protein